MTQNNTTENLTEAEIAEALRIADDPATPWLIDPVDDIEVAQWTIYGESSSAPWFADGCVARLRGGSVRVFVGGESHEVRNPQA